MTKNPYLNAGAAAAYIGGVVLFMSSMARFEEPDTLLLPITFLSLLVLSVLMMAYCFFFEPVQMYLDGHKDQAVHLFTKSLMTFAGIVVVLLGVLSYLMTA
jgi:hypothetical protein